MIRVTYLPVFAFFAITLGENCDKQGILLYEDLACQVKTKDSSCPTSYDCKDLNVPNRCVVQGKVYKIGEAIPSNSNGRFSCESGCTCTSRNNSPDVKCAQKFCDETKPPGCYNRYNLEKCCREKIACPPYDDTYTRCIVNYLEFITGERIAPKDSCHVCICQKGFTTGKYEAPYCKRRGCDTQLKYQMEVQKFCAPVYIQKFDNQDIKCCPTVWTCPDGSEHIKTSGTNSESTCKYGEKVLKVGDSFEKEIQYSSKPLKIECKCNIPPLLTCYQK